MMVVMMVMVMMVVVMMTMMMVMVMMMMVVMVVMMYHQQAPLSHFPEQSQSHSSQHSHLFFTHSHFSPTRAPFISLLAHLLLAFKTHLFDGKGFETCSLGFSDQYDFYPPRNI